MSKSLTIGSFVTLVCLTIVALAYSPAFSDSKEEQKSELKPQDKLVLLWTSGDREVALKMAFMYTSNAPRFGWWDDVTVVIWGPSQELLSKDTELQEYIAKMQESGIRIEACKACADMYGVSDKLASCGIDVKYMGDVLTDYIKSGRHVLTI